jgi:hypothetical protein
MDQDSSNLHRNNAAEWVMYIGLLPIIIVLRLVTFISSRLRG